MFRDFAGTVREADDRPRPVRFDTDFYRIGIGTFVSGRISPNREHLITYNTSEGQECKGIVAGLKSEGRGTLKFKIDHDDGITHMINVPNSVHTPDLPMVLVSPQHWAHNMSDSTGSTFGGKNNILTF